MTTPRFKGNRSGHKINNDSYFVSTAYIVSTRDDGKTTRIANGRRVCDVIDCSTGEFVMDVPMVQMAGGSGSGFNVDSSMVALKAGDKTSQTMDKLMAGHVPQVIMLRFGPRKDPMIIGFLANTSESPGKSITVPKDPTTEPVITSSPGWSCPVHTLSETDSGMAAHCTKVGFSDYGRIEFVIAGCARGSTSDPVDVKAYGAQGGTAVAGKAWLRRFVAYRLPPGGSVVYLREPIAISGLRSGWEPLNSKNNTIQKTYIDTGWPYRIRNLLADIPDARGLDCRVEETLASERFILGKQLIAWLNGYHPARNPIRVGVSGGIASNTPDDSTDVVMNGGKGSSGVSGVPDFGMGAFPKQPGELYTRSLGNGQEAQLKKLESEKSDGGVGNDCPYAMEKIHPVQGKKFRRIMHHQQVAGAAADGPKLRVAGSMGRYMEHLEKRVQVLEGTMQAVVDLLCNAGNITPVPQDGGVTMFTTLATVAKTILEKQWATVPGAGYSSGDTNPIPGFKDEQGHKRGEVDENSKTSQVKELEEILIRPLVDKAVLSAMFKVAAISEAEEPLGPGKNYVRT